MTREEVVAYYKQEMENMENWYGECPHCKAEHRVFDGSFTGEYSPEYVKRNCANCGKEFWLVATQIMEFTALKPPRKQKPEPHGVEVEG